MVIMVSDAELQLRGRQIDAFYTAARQKFTDFLAGDFKVKRAGGREISEFPGIPDDWVGQQVSAIIAKLNTGRALTLDDVYNAVDKVFEHKGSPGQDPGPIFKAIFESAFDAVTTSSRSLAVNA